MPVLRGGGKGNEVLYDSAAVIRWYAERDAEIENEKLRREVEELRQASETDLQPGTIEYERHRLTRAQADAQELKNARDSAEVVETAFCTFVLSRIAGEIASILDGIPLSVQRRFPQRRHPRRTRKRRKPAQNPQKRLPHRPPVRRRHRHHRRQLQKMRRPDRRQQRRAAPRQHPRRRQRQLAVRRRQHRAKVRRNPRQRAPRQQLNGQRILHPPWRLRMQVRRKRG